MPSMITLKNWYDKYDKEAKKQGWSLFTRDDNATVDICRLDEVDAEATTEEEAVKLREERTQLRDDGEALDVVIKQAMQGCVMSLLALYLDGKTVEYPACDNTEFFCPRLLRRGNWLTPTPRSKNVQATGRAKTSRVRRPGK